MMSNTPLLRLAPRALDSNKGDFGRALLIGGSRGMSGAIALAGTSCARSGAGLVRLATPSECLPMVAAVEPSLMTVALPADASGRIARAAIETLEPLVHEASVVAIGPGLGRSDDLLEVVGWIFQHAACPLVVDADALNALAKQPAVLSRAAGPRVFTPHPGEFGRLIGRDKIPLPERETLARQFAAEHGIVTVLKGHRTVISDGTRLALNDTGNPGMATGGTGDVLTGIITGILAQKLEPFDAARLGCHVHGVAGDLAAAELGQISLIASDLLRFLPPAWQLVQAGEA